MADKYRDSYHVRHFLNKKGVFATSQITAFCGERKYWRDNGEDTHYTETALMISDCSKTIRIHPEYGEPIQDFVDKLRLISKTCSEFADYLTHDDAQKVRG